MAIHEDGLPPDGQLAAARDEEASGTLSTVRRGLRALEFVAEHEGISTKELAHRLRVPPATAYHLVTTLIHDGYVYRLADGSLVLGDRLTELVTLLEHRPDPFPELRPIVADLARSCGDVAVVGRLVGNQTLISTAAAAPGAAHGDHIRAGSRGLAHTMSLGKVLVAVLPPDAVLGTLRAWRLKPLTDRTIVDARRLLDELELVRQRGYALDVEEGEPGLCCVAAPIRTPNDRPHAAIAVAVESDRLRSTPQRLVADVMAAARRASELLREHPRNGDCGRPRV